MLTRTVVSISLLLIITSLFFFYLNGNPPVFPLDDAYIHFVYAQNLAEGHGLCFNAGEKSFGSSSPLWVAILSLCSSLGIDLYVAALVLSFLFFFVSSVLVFMLCEEIFKAPGSRLFAFMAALLYVSSGNTTWICLSGMETSLFVMLCLSCVYLYLRNGFDIITAIVAGLVVMCRVTGMFLIVPMLSVDYFKYKKFRTTILITVLIVFPYYLYQKLFAGSFFPVTARGKILTYVNRGWNIEDICCYLAAIIKYLFLYEPAFFIALLISVAGLSFMFFKKKSGTWNAAEGFILLCLWILFHVGAHAVMFRTLNQNFRYLAVIFPCLSIITVYTIYCLFDVKGKRTLAVLIVSLLVIVSFSRQMFWKGVYQKNIEHMDRVYIKCAKWIVKNTSDSRIAAFDIGIIKHISGRYVVDVGGVTDVKVHPYLRTHDVGRYIRRKSVSLVVYSRMPDCDMWSGIYRSEYDRQAVLRQSLLASFSTELYKVPSITHSFKLDVYRVDDWMSAENPRLKDLFYTGDVLGIKSSFKKITDSLELTGVDPEQSVIQITNNMPQQLVLLYYWKATDKIMEKPEIRTLFVHANSGRIIFEKKHTPTHDLFPPAEWMPGKTVRERHVIWIPDVSPPGRYEIRVGNGRTMQTFLCGSFVLEKSVLNILY